jgi:nucleotide-binding universal stress UspA family protein
LKGWIMAIRTILVAISGGAASEGAIDTACRLTTHFSAHLEALHVRVDPRDALPLLGQDISAPVAAELIDLANREGEDNSGKAKALFEAAAARHSLTLLEAPASPRDGARQPSASWREELGYPSAIVPQRARLNDLVVLGQSGRVDDKPYTDTLEETVLHGGRPVLLAPPRPAALIGKVIAIAWNGSPEAARAVGAALPLLSAATTVHILTAGEDDDPQPQLDLAGYLAWHGIAAATHRIRPVKGVGTGELVLAEARDHGADLLVMGGYGQSPWREMIFGGATRQVVGTSSLPIFLAH